MKLGSEEFIGMGEKMLSLVDGKPNEDVLTLLGGLYCSVGLQAGLNLESSLVLLELIYNDIIRANRESAAGTA